jgi:hypothetical protein
MRRDLQIFFLLQILAGVLATLSFRLIEVRWQAAMVAGGGFVLVGAWMVIKTLRWPDRFRTFSFYFCRLHLWVFALPMLLMRLKYFGREFTEIHFLGLSGPMFHRVAELVYLLMITGTLVDWWRVKRATQGLSEETRSASST